MKKIRLGNDIAITWTVTAGSPVDLSEVVITLIDQYGEECPISDVTTTATGTTIYQYAFSFYGKDQARQGVYRILLQRNEGEQGMVTLDHVDAFQLVGVCDFGIVEGEDEDHVETVTVELSSTISTSVEGEGFDPEQYYTKNQTDVLLSAKENTLNYYSEDESSTSASIECGNASIDVESVDGGTISLEATHTSIEDGDGNGILVGIGGTSGVSVETSGTYKFTYNGEEVATKSDIPSPITVDDTLSTTSVNPVQNKVITAALDDKYQAPSGGIPATDLAQAVQNDLALAASALQDAPSDGQQYARKDGEWVEVEASGGGGSLAIVEVASGTSAITAETDKYYKVAGDVTTLAVTLPTIATSETSVKEVAFSFTTGSNPNVTFGTADSNAQIKYYDGFLIASFNAYEVKCVYNGTKWIVSEIRQSGGAGPVGAGEIVTVSVKKIDGQTTSTITTGVDIIVVVEGQTYFYTTGSNGDVQFVVPYGSTYTVTAAKIDALYIANNFYTRQFTAGSSTRSVVYYYRTASLGLYITDADGYDYTLSDWEDLVVQGVKTNDQALYIHVVEGNLVAHGGTFLVGIDLLRNRSYGTAVLYSSLNAQYNTIPLNGNTVTSNYYYDGFTQSSVTRAELIERNSTYPALLQAMGSPDSPVGVTVGGEFCQGFIGSYGQWYILWANREYVDEILVSTRPNGTYTFSSLTTRKWTSSQANATAMWQCTNTIENPSYSSKAGGNPVPITIPFYSF